MVWWFPATGGVRRGAFPLEPMEYVFVEGTASLYDVMYDTVHAVPATPVSAVQSEFSSATSVHRALVRMSDGTMYVAYVRVLAGKFQVYVKRSEDDGATWTDETRISTYANMATQSQYYPDIAVDSNDNLHVVWYGLATGFTGTQIWYALYDGSWHTPVRISTSGGMNTRTQSYPVIAVDSNNHLHVTFSGRSTLYPAFAQTFYATAVPPYAAGDWVTPIRISTALNMAGSGMQPSAIAVDSNNYLHVIWYGSATGYPTIQMWYAKGVPPYAATDWTTPIRISTALNMATKVQGAPSIAVDSEDNLHVVWMGGATDFAIDQIRYATAVPPHGAGDWVTPIRISTAPNMAGYAQLYPSIAVDSNDYLHVLWYGKATGYTTQNVVWLAVYVVSWATPECIQPTGRNQFPALRWSRWPR